MAANLLTDARARKARLIGWRRYLHANPELSGYEQGTAAYLARQLRDMALDCRERFGGTFGLVADVPAGHGPAVALRADMDALPVQEETGLPFRSRRPGVMHACGHDAHMAMLLGAAELLASRRSELRRPVRLIFQPHEEKFPGGAQALIAAGVLEGVASVFGLHIWSQLPTGTLGTRPGAFMSSNNDVQIRIRGRGGHAAMPEQCVDPVVIAAQVVLALQTVVSRSIAMTDSAVVSITRLDAGTAENIIPETATLRGTVRTLDEAVRARACQQVRRIAEGIATAAGATAEVDLRSGYPALINDAETVNRVLQAACKIGIGEVVTLPAQGGGEDFAYYAQRVPAAFAFLGAGNPARQCGFPHHHPRFNIDEDALPLGAALLAQCALDAGAD